MSYGSDFATADPGNAPLDPVIFIGAEPSFWGAILLAILAALIFGWYLGDRSGGRRPDAAHAIWQAIYDAARSAMGADDNALKGRAEALRKVIEARLGKTLILTGGLCGLIEKLDNAIDGRGPGHAASSRGHAPAHGGHDPGKGHGEPAAGGGGGGGGAATANITIVTGTTPDQSSGAAHDHAHDTHDGRDLTPREQTDALRLAVAAFNQHWRDESLRTGELRAAHAELSNPGPRHGAAQPARGKVHGTRAKH